MTKLTALKKKIAALEAQVARVTKAELGNGIAKVRKIMADYGLTIEHLADGAKHVQAAVSKKSIGTKPAKAAKTSKGKKPAKAVKGKKPGRRGRPPGSKNKKAGKMAVSSKPSFDAKALGAAINAASAALAKLAKAVRKA